MASLREQLVSFTRDQADQQPTAKRAALYRALSEICGDEADAAKFIQLAEILESADRKCREFAFQFNQQGGVK